MPLSSKLLQWLRQSVKLVATVILLTLPIGARAQLLQPHNATFNDKYGILQAMKAGDSERLNVLRKESIPVEMQDMANASYFRSLLRLQTSSEYASKCYVVGMQKTFLEKNPTVATLCGQLLAGNFSMEGRFAAWAKIVHETKQAVLPVLRRITGFPNVTINDFAEISATPFTGFVAANRVLLSHNVMIRRVVPDSPSTSSQTATYRLSAPDALANVYLVKVWINGKEKVMVLDTGSSMTMLRPETARKLGIAVNPSPYLRLEGGGMLPIRPKDEKVSDGIVRLGLIQRIRIGSGNRTIRLEGIPVGVGGHFDVLGMNILSRLNSLFITRNDVVLDSKDPPMTCDKPLEIASRSMGAYIPLVKYPINGAIQRVAFDSGSLHYLIGTSSASTAQKTGPDVIQKQFDVAGVYEDRYIPVNITMGAGLLSRNKGIKVFPGYKESFKYAFGVKALKDFNVLLDFQHGKACLEPISSQS